MRSAFSAIRRVAEERRDVRIVYPLHKNGEVRKIAEEELSGCKRIMLSEPIGVVDFHNVMKRAYLVLTDSGGIQEETTVLNVPCLTLREHTERPITCEQGTNTLVGSEPERFFAAFDKITGGTYRRATVPPLWDGKAADRIAYVITTKWASR